MHYLDKYLMLVIQEEKVVVKIKLINFLTTNPDLL